jgi:hypothetical protein
MSLLEGAEHGFGDGRLFLALWQPRALVRLGTSDKITAQ